MRFSFLSLVVLALLAPAFARADVLQGVNPLQESELSQLCGGFMLPNGINLNVGIDNAISLNGAIIANSTLELNGNIISTSSTGTTRVVGNGGATTVQLSSAGSAIITNTANNVNLNQIRTITVDMSNFTRQSLLSISSLSHLQAEGLIGLRNGLH